MARNTKTDRREKFQLGLALSCGAFLALGWGLSWFAPDPVPSWSVVAALAVSCVLGIVPIAGNAWRNLLRGKFEIDLLMIVAAAGAAMLGAWLEAALLLFLFAIGHALESLAMSKARRAIEALAKLVPDTARVRRDGKVVEVRAADLRPGEIVVVRPNERIAADGFITQGETSIDQSAITGESIPADKLPVTDPRTAAGHFRNLPPENVVYSGTINLSGAIEFCVVHAGKESTIARIGTLVQEAETGRSPTQRFTTGFERIYVPIVLGTVVLLSLAFLVIDEPAAQSFYRAMAVLIGASPCALAISTPSAVLSGVARAARNGVLIKGGAPLETLGRATVVAFDKTGTLTTGRPKVTEIVPAEGTSEIDLLRIVVAVERMADHPLAVALVRDVSEKLKGIPIPQANGIESVTGHGIQALVEGTLVRIGKASWFSDDAPQSMPAALRHQVSELERNGRTIMVATKGNASLGAIALMDRPRTAARETVQSLRRLGIRKMLLLSGDNQHVVEAVAREIGIDQGSGNLLPQEKVGVLREQADSGETVVMVGDGVNDAPAMAIAHVGVSMGGRSSAIALETSDMALIGDDIGKLPFAIRLSRATIRIIRQNLIISLGMVALLIPLALGGLQLAWAVMLHEGSTVVVVLNALRLLVYRDPGNGAA